MNDDSIVSADSHVIEPHDLWLNYTPSRYKDRVPRLVRDEDSDKLVGENFESKVGLLPAALFDQSGKIEFKGTWEDDVFKGGYDPHQRVKDIAEDGVDVEILFPTTALSFYSSTDDIDYLWALLRAYNTWLADFCGEYPEQLKGIGMMTIGDMDAAVTEMQRCKELGHVGVMIPLFPGQDVVYRESRFEPLWRTAAELGLPMNIHSSTARDKSRSFFNSTAFTDRMLNTPHQIQRVLLDLIFSGVFDRNPQLRVISAENDAGWAGNIAERGDYWWSRIQQLVPEEDVVCEHEPSFYLHRNVGHAFMRDRTAVLAHEVIGPSGLMWGNDFPHYITTWPNSRDLIEEYRKYLEPDDHRNVFGGNARRIYEF